MHGESGDSIPFSSLTRIEKVIDETQKRIPGAIGFPGELVEIVLADAPDENVDVLEPLEKKENSAKVRRSKLLCRPEIYSSRASHLMSSI